MGRCPARTSMARRTLSRASEKVACQARHHGISITHGHHAGGKHVAVLVGEALAIAEQEAVALQALIEIVGIVDIAVADARIENFDVFVEFEPDGGQRGCESRLRGPPELPCRARTTQSCWQRGSCGLLHLRQRPRASGCARTWPIDSLQSPGDRIKPGRELCRISFKIGDMVAGHTRIHCRLGDGHRNARDEARIKGHRNQIVTPKRQARAMIGGGHFIRHIFARQFGQRAWPQPPSCHR